MATVCKYISLLIEDTRLNVAEKLTRLLSAASLFLILVILTTVALVFLSIAVGIALSVAITPRWSFIIVAAFYLILLVVLVTCRRKLIENPVARFVSALIVKEPEENTATANPSTPENV